MRSLMTFNNRSGLESQALVDTITLLHTLVMHEEMKELDLGIRRGT